MVTVQSLLLRQGVAEAAPQALCRPDHARLPQRAHGARGPVQVPDRDGVVRAYVANQIKVSM